nr:ABC transporter ATP-binding protein/permease [Streptomyces sp. 891-h]
MSHSARSRTLLRPRSVVPGRQRWEVDPVRGRPNLARLIEASLIQAPGIEEVRASPVTGRVLLRHDRTLSPREAARLLGRAVDRARTALLKSVPTARGRDSTAQPAGSGRERAEPPQDTGFHSGLHGGRAAGLHSQKEGATTRSWLPVVLGLGGATAAAVGGGSFLLGIFSSPLVALGVAAAATTVVVRRTSRRSAALIQRQSDGAAPQQSDGAVPRRHALWRLMGPHKRQFGVAALLSGLSQLAEMALFALTPSAVLVLAKGGSATLAGLGVPSLAGQLSMLAGAAGLACLAMSAAGYGAGVAWRRLGHDVEADWRTRAYAHVQQAAPADLESERVSRVNTVLSEDISQFGVFIGSHMHDVVQMVASLGLLVPMFVFVAPQLAWFAFLPVPFIAWLTFRLHERAVTSHAHSEAQRAQLSSRMTENLHAHTTIKSAVTEKHELSRIGELNQECSVADRATARSAALLRNLLRLVGGSALVGTVLLGGRAVLRGKLSLAAFGPMVEMPGIALSRISRMGSASDQYQRTLTALDRVEHLHGLPVEPVSEGRDLPLQQVKGEVELRKVTFSYPGRAPALHDTSLLISPGRTTAIVGTTGAGKTTVAKLLLRFRHPDRGQVLLDGADVRTLALPDLRRAIGYVAQEPFLFDASVADNIRYGAFHTTDDQLLSAARTAGADAFIQSLPDGYGTMIGERGAALSGGQKQRIALARTILRDPPVVILDEATSAVDNETEAVIQQALHVFGTGRTMVVIAHRLSTVQSADRIYVMGSGGRVIEQGAHRELVARGGTYANLWKLQTGQAALA